MNIIACYPRSMSSWLSGFITIPNYSMYLHDISPFPETVEALQNSPYENKGFVDTAITIDRLPPCNLIIIDNSVEQVREKVINFIGNDDCVNRRKREIEELKKHGIVFHLNEMDEWIRDFFYITTGLELDWTYYRAMKNLNIQEQSARNLKEKH